MADREVFDANDIARLLEESEEISQRLALLTSRQEVVCDGSGEREHWAAVHCRVCRRELARIQWTLFQGDYIWRPNVIFPPHFFFDRLQKMYRRSRRSQLHAQKGLPPRSIDLTSKTRRLWGQSRFGTGLIDVSIFTASGYVVEEQQSVFDIECQCNCINAVTEKEISAIQPPFEYEPWAAQETL